MQQNRTSNEDAPRRGAHFRADTPSMDSSSDDVASTHVGDSAHLSDYLAAEYTTPTDTIPQGDPQSANASSDPDALVLAQAGKAVRSVRGGSNTSVGAVGSHHAETSATDGAGAGESGHRSARTSAQATRRSLESVPSATLSRASRKRGAHKGEPPQDLGHYMDVNRYSRTGRRRNRMSKIKVVTATIIVIIMAIGVAVALYVSDINSRLTRDITAGLRDQLEHSEPGDPFYLLLLGIDKDQGRVADTENYGADDHAYRSDSIMLCRIDPKNVKVTMVSIHRDTLINMDEHGQQKINAAYAFGGAEYATEVVSEFAGVPISHYAEVDLDRFISIVDVLGGIEVDLPVPVYDPEYTGLNLPAGKQKLNGLEAALLCRCRHGYDAYGDGDLFRAANQRMVFSVIIKTVMRSDPATIVATITQMADSVTTDMSLADILDLAGQMQSINVDTDIMTGMEPTEGVQIGDGWYEVCLTSAWNKMMNRVNKGLPPYEDGEYDSTAGVAGSVGEAGEEAAKAAESAGTNKPGDTSTQSNEGDTEDGAVAQDNSDYYEPESVVEVVYYEPEPEVYYEEEYYEPEYYEPEYYEEY